MMDISEKIKKLEAENSQLKNALEEVQEERYIDEMGKQAEEESSELEAGFESSLKTEDEYWRECQQEYDLNAAWEEGIKSQDKAVSEGLKNRGSEAGKAMRERRKDLN